MAYKHLVNFWPLVPAVDLQSVTEAIHLGIPSNEDFGETFESYVPRVQMAEVKLPVGSESAKELNCLILGDGLGCLIKTLARAYRHKVENLNMYVAGNCPESLTRILLLLRLFTDNSSSFSLLDRVEMFLEIFGNTFVRYSTSKFTEETSRAFIEELTSKKEFILATDIVSKTFLKQKDIDEIVDILTYLKDSERSYDVAKSRENSLRSYFGSRYDNRKNLFDYHFNMNLSDYSIINLRKYMEWSETGIAFKFRKAKFNFPNKTFRIHKYKNNGIFVNKEKLEEVYCGDIATSPYLTFGIECGNKDFFRKANNQYVQTSEDISKFNLIDMMNEYGSLSGTQKKNLRIYLMLHERLVKSQKFESLFDIIYITCDLTGYADLILPKFLNKNGTVIFETVKNVVNSTKAQKLKHCREIERLAELHALHPNVDWNSKCESHRIFVADKQHLENGV